MKTGFLMVVDIVLIGSGITLTFIEQAAEAGLDPSPAPAKSQPDPNRHLSPINRLAQGYDAAGSAWVGVTAFAQGSDHLHWLHILPNGQVLVAKSNAPCPNRIILLHDVDGVAEAQTIFGIPIVALRKGRDRRRSLFGQNGWGSGLSLDRRHDL